MNDEDPSIASSRLFDISTIKPQEIYSYDPTGEENNFHDFIEVESFSRPPLIVP